MQRALDLARTAIGNTAPNPMVGCVIVKDGKIIGEGYHPRAGEPHAEIFALRSAQKQPHQVQPYEAQSNEATTVDTSVNTTVNATVNTVGATLYVNLEPCNHTGRTPPCSDAVIASGVSRVVIGMVDPNPKVAGSGIEKIKAAGITVTVGVEEEACQTLNEAFVHRILHQRPFGILKYAMTMDGKIATTTGHSTWITSPDSRRWVHELRSHCQAIIIGGNTVRKDNPNLTCHGVSDRIPLRVVMSRSLELPTVANLWNCDQAPTVVFTEPNPNRDIHNALINQGVEIVELEVLTPDAVMKNLYDRGNAQVLWECGGTLAARALQDKSVQKLYAFIAPKIIGGALAPTPIGDLGLTEMTQAIELKKVGLQSIGPDWLVNAYV